MTIAWYQRGRVFFGQFDSNLGTFLGWYTDILLMIALQKPWKEEDRKKSSFSVDWLLILEEIVYALLFK